MANRPLGYATVAILRAIDEDRRYGLDIIDATGLATGTVYVTLGRLQKRGFVTTSWEDQRVADREGRPRRRYYRLTPHGRAALQQALDRYDALTSGAAARISHR
jgi:DNA-binding PadR family transcriptional regulator